MRADDRLASIVRADDRLVSIVRADDRLASVVRADRSLMCADRPQTCEYSVYTYIRWLQCINLCLFIQECDVTLTSLANAFSHLLTHFEFSLFQYPENDYKIKDYS